MVSISGATARQSKSSSTEFEITRRLPDGLIEIQDARGRRWRGQFFRCEECERDLPAFKFEESFDPFTLQHLRCRLCKDCVGEMVERQREERITSYKRQREAWVREYGDAIQRRVLALSRAKVKWRDNGKIAEIYAEARRLTQETGVPHDVDHIYPLQSRHGCGLHVHWNLRVATASENRSKNNGWPMQDSPCIVAAKYFDD